ncbi:MAG: DUF748 domain-containing protein [Marinagarivorans sp.]|nr:DUF748 domain-containing protein [Marinagarivorans sp.]
MRLMKGLFVVLATLAFLLALAPMGARFYAVHWLEKNGYTAKIDTLSFNVISSHMTIAGVDIRSPSQEGFKADLIEVHIDLAKLMQKAMVLNKLKTQGLHLKFAKLDTDLSSAVEPVHNFINQHLPDWRFEAINALNENVTLCRAGIAESKKSLAQCLTLNSATLQDVTVQKTARGWQLITRSSAHMQGIYFKDTLKNASLIYIGDLKIRDILADDTERRISQITANDFHLVESADSAAGGQSTPYQTQLDSLLINDIVETHSTEQSRVKIALVDITALRQTLHKDHNAALVIVQRLREAFPSLDVAIDEGRDDSAKAPKMVVEILKTRIVDGGVAWLDDSVEPPAQASLMGLSLEVGAMNSARPNDRSPVTFVAKLGDGGDVFAQGQLAVFSPTANFGLEGHLRGLDLAKISAYTQTVFNEKVTSGRMDAKFRIDVLKGQVQGDSRVRFTDLSSSGEGGAMSLQASFNRLKTKNQDVDFDLYFNYALPNISALGETLGKEAKRTLGALASGQAPRKPSEAKPVVSNILKFDPLKYAPNQQELSGLQELSLRDIVLVAKENPNKRLMICNVTTAGEWAAIYRQGKTLKSWEQVPSVEQAHLLDMARARNKLLSKQLVAAEMNKGQVHYCEPALALDDNGPSYLSISLE